jgi:hypothetical protein
MAATGLLKLASCISVSVFAAPVLLQTELENRELRLTKLPPPVMTFAKVTDELWLKVSVPASMATLPVKPPVPVSVRVLAPLVKSIASARVTPSLANPPEIVPLLMIVRLLPVTPHRQHLRFRSRYHPCLLLRRCHPRSLQCW